MATSNVGVNIDTPQAVATPGNVFHNPSAGNMLAAQGGNVSTPGLQTMVEKQRVAPVQDWRTAEAYQYRAYQRAYQSSSGKPRRLTALDWASSSFVVSLNLKRRHLNEGQRAQVALKTESFKQRGNPSGSNQHARKDANLHDSSITRAQAAELFQVSPRSVATATKVEGDAAPKITSEGSGSTTPH